MIIKKYLILFLSIFMVHCAHQKESSGHRITCQPVDSFFSGMQRQLSIESDCSQCSNPEVIQACWKAHIMGGVIEVNKRRLIDVKETIDFVKMQHKSCLARLNSVTHDLGSETPACASSLADEIRRSCLGYELSLKSMKRHGLGPFEARREGDLRRCSEYYTTKSPEIAKWCLNTLNQILEERKAEELKEESSQRMLNFSE